MNESSQTVEPTVRLQGGDVRIVFSEIQRYSTGELYLVEDWIGCAPLWWRTFHPESMLPLTKKNWIEK